MYQCLKKLIKYKEYRCFDHSNFPAHLMFTSDVCWGSLGTSIFGNSSSAANITPSRLPSRLSFRFLWLCLEENTCDNEVFSPPFFNHFSLSLNIKKCVVMRGMRKKLNLFTLQLLIYYVLE